jgi:hypothetical protein
LIKFQPFLEGEIVIGITDHAALTWSRTFQNVNHRLLTWGTVFSAYPELKIVHRAGRIHSNVDPISRLRHRLPIQDSPTTDTIPAVELSGGEDPLKNMYEDMGSKFEEKLLNVATRFIHAQDSLGEINSVDLGEIPLDNEQEMIASYVASRTYNVLVGISEEELNVWATGYLDDPHFSKVLKGWKKETNWTNPHYPQYHYSDNGLIYFEDWHGNNRLCVPKSLRASVMGEVHNTLTESAHGGYHRCYNRLAATYYWPSMSRELKRYVSTCNICQKSKPRRHAPTGLLQPIPIPTQPFEVISMDFVPELPESGEFDNILVIVDKLTKYSIIIPCKTEITELETAKLFFQHVVCKFGIPKQVITDRDTRWRNDFWLEVCRLMGMKRALTTAYHPQADGQTEVMNQTLEIALRAYIGPSRNDWADYIDGFTLSYNSTPHSSTNFSPAFLLHGFQPVTGSTLISNSAAIPRPINEPGTRGGEAVVINDKAQAMIDEFESTRTRAKESLLLAQIFQKRAYNNGRLTMEFEEGEFVVINPHSLNLLRNEKGRGKKLLMKYDGPFEIIRKLSPVTYQLRLPVSYGIHPILNIAHLEAYNQSPSELGSRPLKTLNREDFEAIPEVSIDRIVAERRRKIRGKRVQQFKVRWQGFGPEDDEWLSKRQLRNAPLVLEDWKNSQSVASLPRT